MGDAREIRTWRQHQEWAPAGNRETSPDINRMNDVPRDSEREESGEMMGNPPQRDSSQNEEERRRRSDNPMGAMVTPVREIVEAPTREVCSAVGSPATCVPREDKEEETLFGRNSPTSSGYYPSTGDSIDSGVETLMDGKASKPGSPSKEFAKGEDSRAHWGNPVPLLKYLPKEGLRLMSRSIYMHLRAV